VRPQRKRRLRVDNWQRLQQVGHCGAYSAEEYAKDAPAGSVVTDL